MRYLPIGIIVDCFAVLFGGFIGARLGLKLNLQLGQQLPVVLGLGAFALGIKSLMLIENPSVIILSLVVGFALGHLLKLSQRVATAVKVLTGMKSDEYPSEELMLMVLLFCFSATGIFGCIIAGANNDHSVLLAKSVLDFFTAAIFAATTTSRVTRIILPQLCCLLLFWGIGLSAAGLVGRGLPNDFFALGGLITVGIGFKMMKILDLDLLKAIPSFAILLIMTISYFN